MNTSKVIEAVLWVTGTIWLGAIDWQIAIAVFMIVLSIELEIARRIQ